MKCAIMQPTYNPWLGYFDLMDKVDIFVYLDNVQLARRSWQVRNRIKTPHGELFLTIPIKRLRSREETLICNAVINNDENWKEKHLKAIELNYRKAKYFDSVFPFVEDIILSDFQFLGDFNIHLIEKIKRKIGIDTPTIKSTDLPVMKGKKDELLANICKFLNANTYISPQGSAAYIEKETPGGAFARNGIELYYHNYEHPIYSQLYGEFIPYMGIFDLLFNEGFENALYIIRKGRRRDIYYKDFRKYFLRSNKV